MEGVRVVVFRHYIGFVSKRINQRDKRKTSTFCSDLGLLANNHALEHGGIFVKRKVSRESFQSRIGERDLAKDRVQFMQS